MGNAVALIEGYLATLSNIATVGGVLAAGWGLLAGALLWRFGRRRHRFSKVYFPSDAADFYDYYVAAVARARRAVFITSDGFNLCNPQSRRAAERKSEAQSAAIGHGAVVLRYQMTRTMHINWLAEIVRMKRLHGDR